jgi:aminopeptidase N
MKTTLAIFIFKTILGFWGPDKYLINPNADVIHYEFNIAINDTTDIIQGFSVTDVKIKGAAGYLGFDLKGLNAGGKGMKVDSAMINDKPCKWSHTDNKIHFYPPFDLRPDSTLSVTISYRGIPADGLIISRNKFGDRTFFSDNWPDRGSNYLPVVDHPSDKATVDFIITAPAKYRIVANGSVVEESPLGNGMSVTRWKEAIPIPVKVMAFGAAPFAVTLAGEVNNVPVWSWVFYQNRKEGFSDYSVATGPLKFYISTIGPYSYEKLANVQSKTKFGGMENAGCIFYAENSVTGKGRAENLIAHEIAHQWFGNSVTEKEWHHIWLSEGFATYMAAAYMEKTYGKERMKSAMINSRGRILKESEKNQAPVIDTTITDLMKLLSTNSYQKGAWVLHMLRAEVGDDLFWKGLALYYQRYRNRNALTDDFMMVMQEVSGRDLRSFFHQWLFVPGEPSLKISKSAGVKKGTTEIVIEQVQDHIFNFIIEILVEGPKGSVIVCVPVNSRKTIKTVDGGPDLKITPDPETKLLYRAAGI